MKNDLKKRLNFINNHINKLEEDLNEKNSPEHFDKNISYKKINRKDNEKGKKDNFFINKIAEKDKIEGKRKEQIIEYQNYLKDNLKELKMNQREKKKIEKIEKQCKVFERLEKKTDNKIKEIENLKKHKEYVDKLHQQPISSKYLKFYEEEQNEFLQLFPELEIKKKDYLEKRNVFFGKKKNNV